MAHRIGDAVLVYYDLLIFDAVILDVAGEQQDATQTTDATSSGRGLRYLVHFPGWSDNWDEWIAAENVLKDSPENRERQKRAKEELALPKGQQARPQPRADTSMPTTVPAGPTRLVAMIGWMKTLDDALTRLDKQVVGLVRGRVSEETGLMALQKRKAEAEVQQAELEVEVARDLKRIKVAEQTALARKRLRDAGISQEEVDAALPIAR